MSSFSHLLKSLEAYNEDRAGFAYWHNGKLLSLMEAANHHFAFNFPNWPTCSYAIGCDNEETPCVIKTETNILLQHLGLFMIYFTNMNNFSDIFKKLLEHSNFSNEGLDVAGTLVVYHRDSDTLYIYKANNTNRTHPSNQCEDFLKALSQKLAPQHNPKIRNLPSKEWAQYIQLSNDCSQLEATTEFLMKSLVTLRMTRHWKKVQKKKETLERYTQSFLT